MLNERQRNAAQLVALGWGTSYVAEQVGVGSKTITRWKRLPEFAAQVERLRPVRDDNPNIRAVLEDALVNATKRDGSPDYPARISAARALMQLGAQPNPEADAAPRSTIVIYRQPDEQAA